MLQISFDNLSKKQKVLEEDTLYSLFQANKKYEELKKLIVDVEEEIELPDITLTDGNNILLLEIIDLQKDSLNESLATLLIKAVVIENQLEKDTDSRMEFEKRIKDEISEEVLDKKTGIPKLKERKETAIDKTIRSTGKGKKWILNLIKKEKKIKQLPVDMNNDNKSVATSNSNHDEITESTIDRVIKSNQSNNNELSENVINEVIETKRTEEIESAATSEKVATRTENTEIVIELEENKPEIKEKTSLIENVAETIVEDILIKSIRDSLEVLSITAGNKNLATTERELILYKLDKFNALSIEAETLLAKQNEKYNSTYTDKEEVNHNQLEKELAILIATFVSEKIEQEELTNKKYVEIEKEEKKEYLNSEPEKEAQQELKENYDQKVKGAKEYRDRQNEIRKNSYFSDIKNSVQERKTNELNNIHLNYENLVSVKSTEVRSKYETKFIAEIDKLQFELLNEKKEFLNKKLKTIEDYVFENITVWHEITSKELNDQHTKLILEKEKIELEIEKDQSISKNNKEKEEYLLEITKLKTEVEEKNKKEARYVLNEETRLQQNQVSIDLQNRLIQELESKKDFLKEVDLKVEEKIKQSLELARKKNEKLKYVLYSAIGLTVVSIGLAVYGLSSGGPVEGSEAIPEQTVEEVAVSSSAEEESEVEPVILSIEEYLNDKDYANAITNYPDSLDQVEQQIYTDKDLEYLKQFITENISLYGALDVTILENNNEKIIEEYNNVEKKDNLSKDRLERVVKAFKETKKEDEAKKVEELIKE